MKVLYSHYSLTPLKKANRLSSVEPKTGVLLKGVLGDKVLFADYFPHPLLGDRPLEQFLSEFKFQDHNYDRKVFDFLLKDSDLQRLTPKTFFNHQLWSKGDEVKSKVVKVKIQDEEDFSFLPLLEKKIRVRLDANGLFNKESFQKYLKAIPDISSIEYIEDPMKDSEWNGISLPCARDFITGSPYTHIIYKPNCEFYPKEETKIIFSSYLGGNLGRWHSYCELIQKGDLQEVHGIHTEGFYQEEVPLFQGSYETGFIADTQPVKKLYQMVANSNWKQLCLM